MIIDKSDPFAKLPPPKATELPSRGQAMTRDNLPYVRFPKLPNPPPEGSRPRILVIDDERTFLDTMQSVLDQTGLSAHVVLLCISYNDGNYESLLDRVNRDNAELPLDAMVIDLNLVGSGASTGGLALLRQLRNSVPELEFVPTAIMTGHIDPDLQRSSTEEGIDEFIIKLDPRQASVFAGTFLPYRFVTELPRWQAAATERFWQNLAGLVSDRLTREHSIADICKFVGERLSDHFGIAAVYVRELTMSTEPGRPHLVLRGGADGLGVGSDPIPLEALPVHKRFLESDRPYGLFGPLTNEDVGDYADKASGRRLLVARMSVRSDIIGLIALYRQEAERPFTRLDGMMAHLLAQQLGAAIFQERAIVQLRGRQDSLPRVLDAFVRADNERDIFKRLQESLHAEIAERAAPGRVMTTIRALEPGTQNIPRQERSSGIGATVPDMKIRLDMASTVAEAVRSGMPSFDNNVTEDTPGFVFTRGGERAHITVPLRSDQVCFGAVCIESIEPNVFSTTDLPFVEALCGAAAEAIIRLRSQRFALGMASLLGFLTVDKQQRRWDMLREAVKPLFEYTGFAELLYLVPPADGSPQDTPWQLHGVFGRNGERYEEGRLRGWKDRISARWQETFIRKSLGKGDAIDYTNDRELISDDRMARSDEALTTSQANLLIRVADGERPEAIISLLFLHPLSLSRYHLALLKEFAVVLARLLDQERRFGNFLEEFMLQDQNARIGLAYHQIRHFLVNKIGGLRQMINLLVARGAKEIVYKDLALVQIDRLGAIVNRANNLVKIPEIKPTDLQAVWRRVLSNLEPVATTKRSTLGLGNFEINWYPTDEAILETILFNLADNAVMHGGDGICVSLRVHRVGDGVALDVGNTGRNIPGDRRDRIFSPGATTQSGNAGLGLYMSRARARDLGGDLTLLPDAGDEVVFRVSLPGQIESESKS